MVALDTNILVYAEGLNGRVMKAASLNLLERLPADATLVPVQVLGELVRVLVARAKRSPHRARQAILSWGDAYPIIETSSDALLAAMDLAADHRLGIWDALILSTAADARCRLLLSEDLQDGFTWGGVTVTNPFSKSRHPVLERMLHGSGSKL